MASNRQLVCILIFIAVAAAQNPLCQYKASDGSFYDLTPLQNNADFTIVAGEYEYYIGICRNTTYNCSGVENCDTLSFETPSCQREVGSASDQYTLGSLNSMSFSDSTFGAQGGVTITYSNGETACNQDKYGRTAVINVVCDISGLSPNAGQLVNAFFAKVDQLNLLVYTFVLVSQYACPQPSL